MTVRIEISRRSRHAFQWFRKSDRGGAEGRTFTAAEAVATQRTPANISETLLDKFRAAVMLISEQLGKTIASGSITLIIRDKLLASFFLNSSIISTSF